MEKYKDFKYEALDETGKTIKGIIEATDNSDAICQIRNRGLFPIKVQNCKRLDNIKLNDIIFVKKPFRNYIADIFFAVGNAIKK